MLSQTLRRFERDGLVERVQYPTIPPKVTYELTDLGLELGNLCRSIKHWSEQHYPAIQAARGVEMHPPTLTLMHRQGTVPSRHFILPPAHARRPSRRGCIC